MKVIFWRMFFVVVGGCYYGSFDALFFFGRIFFVWVFSFFFLRVGVFFFVFEFGWIRDCFG